MFPHSEGGLVQVNLAVLHVFVEWLDQMLDPKQDPQFANGKVTLSLSLSLFLCFSLSFSLSLSLSLSLSFG